MLNRIVVPAMFVTTHINKEISVEEFDDLYRDIGGESGGA